jgi:hypothetical protein
VHVRWKILLSGLLFAILLSIMFGFQVAWATSGTTLCDPSTGKGTWVLTEWTEFPASGCPAYDFYYGRQVFVRSIVTEGSTNTYLYGNVYCDRHAGPHYNGQAPWGCDKVATGTAAIAPLPQRAGTNMCISVADPYPYDNGHYDWDDGVVLMQEKVVSEYRCQCNLTITGFSGDKTTFDPSAGQTLNISGTFVETYQNPVTWTVTIGGAGKTFRSSESSSLPTWNGTDSAGRIVVPGIYTVTFSAQTTSGGCSDSKSLNIKVVEGPKTCTFNSPAN